MATFGFIFRWTGWIFGKTVDSGVKYNESREGQTRSREGQRSRDDLRGQVIVIQDLKI